MKKFFTPILILLAIVCLVAVGNWRSARNGLQTTTSDLLTTSNRLSETTAQLVTKAATVETLRITQNLHAADLTTLSNRLGALAAELDKANQATRQAGEALRQRESELAVGREEIAKLQQTGEELRAETRALQAQLATANAKILVEQQHGETLTAAINELQAETAVFHQQWNDPAILRAQLAWISRAKAVSDGVVSAAKFTKLVMEPDGSVTNVPVFKDIPGPSTPPR
jgi:FtsZ-interacting cell division protein ZipA